MTRLNTKDHNAARLSLGRLIRQYSKGDEIPSQQFRDLIYAMNTLLAYFKLDSDLRIEERLDVIEDAIKEKTT